MLPATIMSTLFLLDVKAYKLTKLDGLNLYGSGGISMKAQTCDGITRDWIGSLFPPSLPRVPSYFVDPHYVLHACHIIPAFSNGKRYQDEVGVSRCAHDSQDWARCYVNW